ncbi:hypothetical protein Pelo_17574 [Pelomyxa schiedti]|nr:hypothetical protein Pelo_17574 [Pelomyxa schiedti]
MQDENGQNREYLQRLSSISGRSPAHAPSYHAPPGVGEPRLGKRTCYVRCSFHRIGMGGNSSSTHVPLVRKSVDAPCAVVDVVVGAGVGGISGGVLVDVLGVAVVVHLPFVLRWLSASAKNTATCLAASAV